MPVNAGPRLKSEKQIEADIKFEQGQARFYREHPEVLLCPDDQFGEVKRNAEHLHRINLVCEKMDGILAGRVAVCGTIDGELAELHGPLSAKGKGGYYFECIALAARITPNEAYDTWVPGGFSIVPIGIDELNEKLSNLGQNGVQELTACE